MNEYINLTPENIANEHICCAIWDPKHQCGVDRKKNGLKINLKMAMYSESLMIDEKYLLNMNLLKLHGFQLMVRIMNIFIVYGLLEVLNENE